MPGRVFNLYRRKPALAEILYILPEDDSVTLFIIPDIFWKYNMYKYLFQDYLFWSIL